MADSEDRVQSELSPEVKSTEYDDWSRPTSDGQPKGQWLVVILQFEDRAGRDTGRHTGVGSRVAVGVGLGRGQANEAGQSGSLGEVHGDGF